MAVNLTDVPKWVVDAVAGPWPEGNEDAMRRLGQAWIELGEVISKIAALTGTARKNALAAVQGEVGKALAAQGIDLSGDLSVAEKACNSLGEQLVRNALSTQLTKYIIKGSLLALAVQVVADLVVPGVGEADAAAATAATRLTVRAAFRDLINSAGTDAMRAAAGRFVKTILFKGVTMGAIQGGGIPFLAETVQMMQGDRGWGDYDDQIEIGLVAGAAGGLAGEIVGGKVMNGLERRFTKDGARKLGFLGRTATRVLGGAAGGGAGAVAGELAQEPITHQFDLSWRGIMPGLVGGAVATLPHAFRGRPSNEVPTKATSDGSGDNPKPGAEGASGDGKSGEQQSGGGTGGASAPTVNARETPQPQSPGETRALAGARARGDSGVPPSAPAAADPHSRTGLPEHARVSAEGQPPSDRPPAQHHTDDPGASASKDHQDGLPHTDASAPAEAPHIRDAFRDNAVQTDAGVSLHGEGSDLSRLAARVPADSRYHTVDVHVTTGGRARIGEHTYTPEQFGDMLREHGWDGEKPLRLIGCDAAENGFAARLAGHLGTDVLSPTEKAWTDENGNVYSSSGVRDDNGNLRPRIPPDGEWHITHPDGTRTLASEDGFAPGTSEASKHLLDPDSAMKRDLDTVQSESDTGSGFDRHLLLPSTGVRVELGDATYVVDENSKTRTKVAVARMEVPVNYKKRGVSHLDHPPGWINGVDHRGHLIPEAGVKDFKDVNVFENIVAQQGNSNLSAKKVWENAVNKYVADHPGVFAKAEVLDRDATGRVNYTEFKLYDSGGDEIKQFGVVLDNPSVKGKEGQVFPLHTVYLDPWKTPNS